MNSYAIDNTFLNLSEQELQLLNGGEFWTGLAIIGGSIALGAVAIMAAPAAATVGAACAVGIAVFGAEVGFAVGLTEALGGNL
jgi:hypothetical protein